MTLWRFTSPPKLFPRVEDKLYTRARFGVQANPLFLRLATL